MREPRSRTARVSLLAGLVTVVAVAVWVAWWPGQDRSVEATVRAFFAAREAADCARLVDLVTEESWSEGSHRTPGEFVEQCADVVDDYQPALAEVEVVSDDGENAVVTVGIDEPATERPGIHEGIGVRAGDDPLRAFQRGHLVREDGRWRVQTNQLFFRLGRSVEQTVRGFVGAYNDGDCPHLVDYLGEALWSDHGRLSRDEYLDRCAEAVEARLALPAAVATIDEPGTIEVTAPAGTDRLTAVARWNASPGSGSLPQAETVVLRNEGLEWKLTSLIDALDQIELTERLLLDPPLPGYELDSVGPAPSGDPFEFFVEGSDVAERRSETGFERGARAAFIKEEDDVPYLRLVLYQFEDEDGARAYADLLAGRLAQQVDARSPLSPVSEEGVRAAVTYCGSADDSCQHAEAALGITVDGRMLVAAEVVDTRSPTVDVLIGQVEEVLDAQLARL